ncbi:MAG: DNA-binding protein [Chloroflexi bacterium]|mgnify:CR=1 FL=1|nr:MAG: DNA-binding protein [Chloroflexota bacterium]
MVRKDYLESDEALCISVTAAAKLLGVSRNTGYEMVKMKQLPVIRCGKRRLVVPKAALKKMLQEAKHANEKSSE